MNLSVQHRGFTLPRRVVGGVCYLLSVASIASAIGVVISVLVLTTPTRSALVFAPLPAIAWDVR